MNYSLYKKCLAFENDLTNLKDNIIKGKEEIERQKKLLIEENGISFFAKNKCIKDYEFIDRFLRTEIKTFTEANNRIFGDSEDIKQRKQHFIEKCEELGVRLIRGDTNDMYDKINNFNKDFFKLCDTYSMIKLMRFKL